MSDQYIAIDVETANSSRGSVCQVGLVAFVNAGIAWEWSSYVNPECDFDSGNVRVHGIGSQTVATAPAWPAILPIIAESIGGQVLISHSRFDYEALHHSCARYNLTLPECVWLDSCDIARMSWPHLPKHDLGSLCRGLDIPLQHHDALSDARACGVLMAHAITTTGIPLSEWVKRAPQELPAKPLSERPTSRRYSERIEAKGDPKGPLAGQVWVCTGDFTCGEAELVRLAASLGCDVKERFGKNATILVVGQRDPSQFGGKQKSRKQLDAEAAIAAGRNVQIMTELEFIELARHYRECAQKFENAR